MRLRGLSTEIGTIFGRISRNILARPVPRQRGIFIAWHSISAVLFIDSVILVDAF